LTENVDKGALEALIWLNEFLSLYFKDYIAWKRDFS